MTIVLCIQNHVCYVVFKITNGVLLCHYEICNLI